MRIHFLALSALLGLIGIVQAKPAAAPPPEIQSTRIALIDMAHIFRRYQGFKDQRAKLRQEIDAIDAVSRQKYASMQKLLAELKTKPRGSAEYKKLQNQLVDASAEYKADRQKMQIRFLAKEAALYKSVYAKVKQQAAETAANKGFSLVLRDTRSTIEGVKDPKEVLKRMNRLFVSRDKSLDITESVLAELNEKYKDGE